MNKSQKQCRLREWSHRRIHKSDPIYIKLKEKTESWKNMLLMVHSQVVRCTVQGVTHTDPTGGARGGGVAGMTGWAHRACKDLGMFYSLHAHFIIL